jgi:hypothetical protein
VDARLGLGDQMENRLCAALDTGCETGGRDQRANLAIVPLGCGAVCVVIVWVAIGPIVNESIAVHVTVLVAMLMTVLVTVFVAMFMTIAVALPVRRRMRRVAAGDARSQPANPHLRRAHKAKLELGVEPKSGEFLLDVVLRYAEIDQRRKVHVAADAGGRLIEKCAHESPVRRSPRCSGWRSPRL